MNISLIPLNTKGRVDIDIHPDMTEYSSDRIKRLENINVTGYILDNGTDDYEIKLNITGIAIVKSDINLEDVPITLNIKYEDFIKNLVEIYKKSANSLDILPIIWENILLEIPIRAVNIGDEFKKMHGDGWEIIEE